MPKGLNHAYFTSGRDEVVDKGLRSIKFHRQEAQIVIGFSHQYFGNITAAARSLSHDEGQAKPFGLFEWPKINHPKIVGNESSLKELLKVIDAHKPQKILAIVVELVGEKSALSFDEEFLSKLEEIRKTTGIPLIFGESTSGFFRNGKNLFLSDSLSVKPNMIWFYSDAQFGNILVDDSYFVQKPLTLISTWDGDDVSIMRSYYKLIWVSKFKQTNPDNFMLKLKNKFQNYDIQGMGYWAGIKMPQNKIEQIIQASKEEGVLLSQGFDNRLMVCPSLDLGPAEQEKIIHTLAKFI
jgi:acetylornithine/succinyldiaminopimelate/putrescine aminotransferase